MLALLLGLALLPPLLGLQPPLGGAEGIERQQDPTRCDPRGNDWTLCANAFRSNNSYAYANGTSGGGADSAFKDSASFSIPAAPSALVDSMATTLPDAPNLILVFVQIDNTGGANRRILGGDIEIRRGTTILDPLIAETEFRMDFAADGSPPDGNFGFLVGRDATPGASPTYGLFMGASGTGLNGEAKFLVINGAPDSDFVDGGSVTLGSGENTLATLATTLPNQPTVVITVIQIDATGGDPVDIATGSLKLKRGAGVLASNQFFYSGSENGNDGDGSFLILIAQDPAPGLGPTYTVTAQPGTTNVANGEAKILAFSGLPFSVVDTGAVTAGTTRTTIGSTGTSFSAGEDVLIGGFQMDATSGGDRTWAAGSIDIARASALDPASNEFPLRIPQDGDFFDNSFVGVLNKLTSEQVNPTYEGAAQAPAAGSFDMELKLVALHIANVGNDTAWGNFGFALSGGDSIASVEAGVEWFRTSTAPVLHVTVSWDGGSSWAATQTATNKSVDDDAVEFLNFTAAAAWDASKLDNTNFQVRVGTNASDARLDYLTARVTYVDAALELSLAAGPSLVDPGDVIVQTATVTNVGSGAAQNILLEASVDLNATYLAATPLGTYDSAARAVRWTVSSLAPGAQLGFEWTIEVNPGTADLATVTSQVRVEGEDSSGLRLPSKGASNQATVRAPVFAPLLLLDRFSAERGDEVLATLYYNNTGSGTARWAWTNWSLGGHYELVSLLPAVLYTAVPDGFHVGLTNLTPGLHLLGVRLRVIRGMEDGLALGLQANWAATDGNGNLLIDTTLSSGVNLMAPAADLSLAATTAPVNVGSVFTLNLTIRNRGAAAATGWLNLTLGETVTYLADNGTFGVTVSGGLITWELASLPANSSQVVAVVLLATGGSSDPEFFRFALNYTDGKGSLIVTAFSNAVAVEVLPGSASPWPWWWFSLPALVVGPLLALVILRRRRNLAIEEVFVMDHRGLLIQHLSRTLTPEQDQDMLAAMLKTMQDFVKDAFSKREDVPLRSLRFGESSILMEQSRHLYVAVVYQGKDNGSLEARLSQLTKEIESEYGELLETWVGDMDEVKGIRDLIPSLWER